MRREQCEFHANDANKNSNHPDAIHNQNRANFDNLKSKGKENLYLHIIYMQVRHIC